MFGAVTADRDEAAPRTNRAKKRGYDTYLWRGIKRKNRKTLRTAH